MGEDDKGKPLLRLAVENDQSDIDRERVRQGIEWPLSNLAANLLRVVRGAGKSHEIGEQCVAVLKAFQEYRDKVGHWPTSFEMEEALSIRQKERPNETYDEYWEWQHAQEDIMRGALQVAASRLVGQLTQEHRGRSDMMDGVRELDRIRDERRALAAEEEKARRQALRAKSTKTKSRTKRKASPARRKPDPDISF